MCYYCKNIIPCFMAYHTCVAHRICSGRFIIPICHCWNHVPECDPLYSYGYKPNTAHFHGESIEYPWPYFNALGPSIWQMNPGRQINTLELHYGDWNYRKLTGMCMCGLLISVSNLVYLAHQLLRFLTSPGPGLPGPVQQVPGGQMFSSCQLLKELETAKITYIDKRDHFVRLCGIYDSKVNLWNTFDCSLCINPNTKNVYSVYFHNNTKGKPLSL